VVRYLLAAGARVVDGNVCSLHDGLWSANVEVVALLLDAGADLEAADYIDRAAHLGHAPPMVAVHMAHKPDGPELVRMVLDRGADVDMQDEMGMTALHYAALRELAGVAQKRRCPELVAHIVRLRERG